MAPPVLAVDTRLTFGWAAGEGVRKTCPRCRARVRWVLVNPYPSPRTTWLPVDVEPTPDGSLLVHDVRYEGTSIEWIETRPLKPGETPHPDRFRYAPHEQTCPLRTAPPQGAPE